MNCFELVQGRFREGIAVEDGHIVLGAEGPGSVKARVPVPSGAEIRDGRVYAVPSKKEGLLVCIRDHSGSRGSWFLSVARSDWEREWVVARAHAHRPPFGRGPLAEGHTPSGPCPACDAIAPAPSDPVPVVPDGLIAEGRRMRGKDEESGGGPEYLIEYVPLSKYEIYRSGKLHGGPRAYLIMGDSDAIISRDPEDDALDRVASRLLSPGYKYFNGRMPLRELCLHAELAGFGWPDFPVPPPPEVMDAKVWSVEYVRPAAKRGWTAVGVFTLAGNTEFWMPPVINPRRLSEYSILAVHLAETGLGRRLPWTGNVQVPAEVYRKLLHAWLAHLLLGWRARH